MKKYKLQNKAIGEYIRENTIDLINKKNNAIELSIASGFVTIYGTFILIETLINTYNTGVYNLDSEMLTTIGSLFSGSGLVSTIFTSSLAYDYSKELKSKQKTLLKDFDNKNR